MLREAAADEPGSGVKWGMARRWLRSRPTFAGLVIIALVPFGGCSAQQGPKALWGACAGIVDTGNEGLPPERQNLLEFQCGSVTVPLDHDSPSGETLALQLVRVHQKSTPARDPLLLIAGGPGQSGVDTAREAAGYLPIGLLDSFDLIGFDPRGVARSGAIRCSDPTDDPQPLPDPITPAGFDSLAAQARTAAQQCAKALGPRASLFNTNSTARDIDLIREALGVEQLTYLGWSYGAKLGAEYAHLHPEAVRAAVLDAPTDPTTPWIASMERQVDGFEHSFEQFVHWCTSQTACDPLGDVRAFAAKVIRTAEATPIASGRPSDHRPSNGTDVIEGIIGALYDNVRWPDLAEGLDEAAHGDSGTLRALAEAGGFPTDAADRDTNTGDANFVINCNDSAPGPTLDEIRAAAAAMVERSPLLGAWGSFSLFGCAFWEPPRHTLTPPAAPTKDPLVVVGTVHDPATPYAGAGVMARTLGNAVLLTWEGEGHTAVGRDRCIGDLVTDYLVTLKVPPDGTRCPA